jgi:hypothetical protein
MPDPTTPQIEDDPALNEETEDLKQQTEGGMSKVTASGKDEDNDATRMDEDNDATRIEDVAQMDDDESVNDDTEKMKKQTGS